MTNSSITVFKKMVKSFINAHELMDLAAWALQDSVAVRFRIFQWETCSKMIRLPMNNRALSSVTYFRVLEIPFYSHIGMSGHVSHDLHLVSYSLYTQTGDKALRTASFICRLDNVLCCKNCSLLFIIYYVMKYRKILIKYNAYISQP